MEYRQKHEQKQQQMWKKNYQQNALTPTCCLKKKKKNNNMLFSLANGKIFKHMVFACWLLKIITLSKGNSFQF